MIKIDADVIARYECGQSTRVIAAALGMGKATVLDILKSANVALRPVGRHSRPSASGRGSGSHDVRIEQKEYRLVSPKLGD